MASFLIGYDLNKTGKDYTSLTKAIKGLTNNWWHCLDSTWIIKHSGPATLIRDSLAPHIDADDEILVVNLTGEGAWRGFSGDCGTWLKNNL